MKKLLLILIIIYSVFNHCYSSDNFSRTTHKCLTSSLWSLRVGDEIINFNSKGSRITKNGTIIESSEKLDSNKIQTLQQILDEDAHFVTQINSVKDSMPRLVQQRLKAEALRAIQIGELLKNGTKSFESIYIINNGLIKRLNSMLGFQEVDLLLVKVKKFIEEQFKKNNLKKPFFTDFRSIQFIAKDSQKTLIEEKILRPLRNFVFDEFINNPNIFKHFSDKKQISEILQTAISFGMGKTHETASFASRVGGMKRVREQLVDKKKYQNIFQFDEELMQKSLDYAKELKHSLKIVAPTFFDISNNLDPTILKIMRKHGNKSLQEIKDYFPDSMKIFLNENTFYTLKDYMRSINVIDYVPLKLLNLDNAKNIINALEKKDYLKAAQIYKNDKKNERLFFRGNLKNSDTSAILALDVVNLGGKNFRAMEEQVDTINKILKNGPKIDEHELGSIMRNALKPVDEYLEDLLLGVTKILEESNIKYEKMLAGDDIFIRIKTPISEIKNIDNIISKIQLITSKSKYSEPAIIPFRTSVAINENNLSPSEMLIRIDKMTDILKKYEEKGISGARIISEGKHYIHVPSTNFSLKERDDWQKLFFTQLR